MAAFPSETTDWGGETWHPHFPSPSSNAIFIWGGVGVG